VIHLGSGPVNPWNRRGGFRPDPVTGCTASDGRIIRRYLRSWNLL